MIAIPSTCWLVHPTKHDLSGLRQWGRIRHTDNIGFVFSDAINEYGEVPPGFEANIRRAVVEFQSDADYLVLTGDPIQLALFGAILIDTYGSYRGLRWNNESGGYVMAVIQP